jgi:hypothetical protein
MLGREAGYALQGLFYSAVYLTIGLLVFLVAAEFDSNITNGCKTSTTLIAALSTRDRGRSLFGAAKPLSHLAWRQCTGSLVVTTGGIDVLLVLRVALISRC